MAGRAARAGAWSALDMLLRQGVTFVVSILLARLLQPADFGVIALLTFFSSLSIIFVQGGLSEALVQRGTTTLEEESSVFWCNLVASLVFGAGLVAVGPAVARFYGQPVLSPLMWVAAAQTVCGALGAVQTALLTRGLRFDQLAKTGVAASLISGALAVGAAALGWGVWALGVQLAASAALNAAGLWLLGGWRPAFRLRLGAVRSMLGFGGWLSLSSALEVLYAQGFALLLGKFYGVRQLGLFNRAAGTQQLPANVFSGIIGRVAFPLFAAHKDDAEALRHGLARAVRLSMLVNLPLMTGVMILPDLVIRVLFGDKWLPAAPILGILAGSGMLFPLQVLNLQLILARGESRVYFRIEIAKKLVGVALVAVGSLLGIRGLAGAMLALAVVALFINAEPVRRSIGHGVAAQLSDLRGVAAASAAMAALVLLVRPLVATSPPALQLAVLAGVGVGTYAAIGLLAPLSAFTEALEIARSLRRRGDPVAALDG